MAIKNPDAKDSKKTVKHMENLSLDPVYEILMRVPLSQNPISGELERNMAIQGNSSLAFTYDGDGNLATLEKTIGATTYTKTFTWTSGSLTSITTWS